MGGPQAPEKIVRMAIIKRPQITNVGKDMEKGNPFTLLVGLEIGIVTMEKYMEVPKKN